MIKKVQRKRRRMGRSVQDGDTESRYQWIRYGGVNNAGCMCQKAKKYRNRS